MVRRAELGSSEIESLRDELTRLREDLAGTLESLINAARSEAGDLREKLVDNAEEWLAEVRGTLDTAGEKGRSALHAVQYRIEDAPLISVGIAFMAGLLIGRLTRRD